MSQCAIEWKTEGKRTDENKKAVEEEKEAEESRTSSAERQKTQASPSRLSRRRPHLESIEFRTIFSIPPSSLSYHPKHPPPSS